MPVSMAKFFSWPRTAAVSGKSMPCSGDSWRLFGAGQDELSGLRDLVAGIGRVRAEDAGVPYCCCPAGRDLERRWVRMAVGLRGNPDGDVVTSGWFVHASIGCPSRAATRATIRNLILGLPVRTNVSKAGFNMRKSYQLVGSRLLDAQLAKSPPRSSKKLPMSLAA